MTTISNTTPGPPSGIGRIGRLAASLGEIDELGIAEKIYGIVALLVVVATLLVVMSVQSVRLQAAYRQLLATSATAAINIERVNGLIYAIVMESRGVYMSTEPAKVRQFSDELLKRNRELANVVAGWELTLRADDAEQFLVFKKRITQFIEFRKELVRRAIQVNAAAGREWGDNDANRTLRIALNVDLEAFARIYDERALKVAELSDLSRYASWYLFALGFTALLLAGLIVFVMRTYIVGPLGQITEATDLIAAGKLELDIPFAGRKDEIGHLARAVKNFRDAACRNLELEQLEIGTALQRDKATGQRDKLNDKYLETKWQLSAAINSVPQGMIMLDAKTSVLAINDQYRKMYGLPLEFKAGCLLEDILRRRVENGLFVGSIANYLGAIVARIAKRQPSTTEVALGDGRLISVQEGAMDGGGWLAMHEDITEQRRSQRILERTERFLATIIENVSEAIVAKDAHDLRYTFVNRAAEKLLGLPRAQILGKSVRDLFPAETAELIEEKDREMLASIQENQVTVKTVDTPNNGRRTISARRLRIAGQAGETQIFLSLIEDLTDRANLAEASA